MRDFLTIDVLTPDELVAMLDDLKAGGQPSRSLGGRAVGLLYEQPVLRSRAAFEVAVRALGGQPVVLDAALLELRRGEAVEDAARVLGGYLDALVVRVREQSRLEALASAAAVPVVNALSDFSHPCQVLADLQTIREYKGALAGVRLAYLGDGNSLANSLLCGGAMAGMDVAVGSPAGYEPIPQVVELAAKLAAASGGRVEVTPNPLDAARAADVVYADAGAVGGDSEGDDARPLIFRPFQVGYHVMEVASPDAIVMHCLPARRGVEIAAEVMDGGQSVVWSQSANQLHTAKALLRHLLGAA